ncbi:MAG: hypothetical protein ACKVT2_17980 [Saprospiraceae bacterium]
MKKEIIFLLFLLAIGSTWLLSCTKEPGGPTKKDPCPWPEITTEGRNTFGCKINGKEWVPCVDIYALAVGLQRIECTLRESDGSNFLSMVLTYSVQETENDTLESLIIGLKPLQQGYNLIGNLDYSKLHFGQIFESGQSSKTWEIIDSDFQNYFEVTRIDTFDNIISGMFKFTLFSEDKQDTLHFSTGRFDVTYYPQ